VSSPYEGADEDELQCWSKPDDTKGKLVRLQTHLLTYLLTSSTPTIDATADEHTKLLTNLLFTQWLNTSQYPYREQKQFRHE